MNELGNTLLLAMANQGFAVVGHGDDHGDYWVCLNPAVATEPTRIPEAWFQAEDDWRLRMCLLPLMVDQGLVWPWPPEPEVGWAIGSG